MQLDQLIDGLPGYAKDLKLNYSSLVRQNAELTQQQLWGTVVASAIATRNPELTAAALEEGAKQLSAQALEAAKAAASVMGMNNIYYRFLHLASNEKYSTMPARLRMNVIRTHGVDHNDFELWSLAVSAINGCGKCVDSHEKVVREKGVSEETVLAVVRVASVIHAIGPVLDAERVAQPEAVAVKAFLIFGVECRHSDDRREEESQAKLAEDSLPAAQNDDYVNCSISIGEMLSLP